LFYLNIYLLFYLILHSKSHFDSNKSKKRSNRKKNISYKPQVTVYTLTIIIALINYNWVHIIIFGYEVTIF